jgi:hypothetical protein
MGFALRGGGLLLIHRKTPASGRNPKEIGLTPLPMWTGSNKSSNRPRRQLDFETLFATRRPNFPSHG